MKGVAALVLLLVHTCLSRPCRKADQVLVCADISSDFGPGFQTLILTLSNVGEINSAVLQNSNLASITRLDISAAGITGIAENALSSFLNLRNLTLESNNLSEINPNWFANPAVLVELKLTSNQIEAVEESTVNGLTNLTKLILNKNWIKRVHPNSFSSQCSLAELDLSENRLTWVSPRVFRSLSSLRSIRLYGNPWNCSCDHKDFVASIKELQSRSRLESPMNVTCETPPPLKGQPVWNVSVCLMPPPSPIPPPTDPTATVTSDSQSITTIISETAALSSMQTSVQTNTDAPTTPASTAQGATTRPSQPTSKTESSFPLKPADAPSTISSHTGAFVTSSLSGTDTFAPPKPTNTPVTPSKTTRLPGTNIVCTLIAVITGLCVLLFVVCFLAVLHRRKRSNKTVMPGCLKEERKTKTNLEEGVGSSNDRSEKRSDNKDPEMARKKSLTGVRAKSANAVILTSPFGSSEKDKVTFLTQTEAPSGSSEKPGDTEQKVETGGEAAAAGGGGGIQIENQTDTEKEYEKRVDDENPECVYADMVPYLSIGTNQNNPSSEDKPFEDPSKKAQTGKVIGRISTWPPTAAQWQARCKMKEREEEDDGEGITVWTQSEALKLSDEVEKIRNNMKQPESSEPCEKEDETEKNPSEADVNLRDSLILRGSTTEEQLKKEGRVQDPATVRQTNIKISQNKELKSAEKPTQKGSSSRTEVRSDLKRAATGRQRAENKAAGSKAPSGGTSPDDETLLSGNEYAFMDLLHEVAQNGGRWTRERWKQTHVNKQRR